MNAGLFGSTGAALMSVFHQLVGGNSGRGAGRSPPRIWAQMRRTVTKATGSMGLFSFTIFPCPNNRASRVLPVGRSRERESDPPASRKVLSMPAVSPEFAQPRRSVLKLSLGLTLAVVGSMLTAIFLTGAPAYAGAVYTLTGLCGNCNWGDSTKWSGGPFGTYPGQVTGDTANVCATTATLTVNVVVPQGVILNLGCTGTTVDIPGTNSLQLEASSTMGSGGNTITVNGGNLILNSGGGFNRTVGNSIILNTGTALNLGTFNNLGTVTIAGGTYTNSGGSTNVANGAVLNLNGGTLTNPNMSIDSGGVSPGTMNWAGGTINGSGFLQITGGTPKAVFNITGANSAMTLDKAQLSNSGTINYSSAANPLSLVNFGNVSNNGLAFFNLQTDTPINGDATGRFENFGGTFSKNGGLGTSNINVQFNNTNGTVTFGPAGLGIAFNGGGTHGGTFQMPLGNSLAFNGAHTFGTGSAFSGSGPNSVSINGGTFQVNTGLTIPANLTNAGALKFGPGFTTRAFSVTGTYTQSAAGSL